MLVYFCIVRAIVCVQLHRHIFYVYLYCIYYFFEGSLTVCAI